MRLAEVAQINSESLVALDGVMYLKVKPNAKTKASSDRIVPVANTLQQRVDLQEITKPPELYEGQDVGKRFGRLKTKLSYSRLHVFHSIRKTAATTFEQAGVPEGITADILGHEKQTMTYGLYSGGTSVTQRQEAVAAFEELMLQLESVSH